MATSFWRRRFSDVFFATLQRVPQPFYRLLGCPWRVALLGGRFLKSLGDSTEVRGLVAALTAKVQGCREELKAQAVGNAVYSLRRAWAGASVDAEGAGLPRGCHLTSGRFLLPCVR